MSVINCISLNITCYDIVYDRAYHLAFMLAGLLKNYLSNFDLVKKVWRQGRNLYIDQKISSTYHEAAYFHISVGKGLHSPRVPVCRHDYTKPADPEWSSWLRFTVRAATASQVFQNNTARSNNSVDSVQCSCCAEHSVHIEAGGLAELRIRKIRDC